MRTSQKKIRQTKRIKNRNNKQKYFYSGKKKRHTLKTQLVVDKETQIVICTSFSNGKKHDFKLFKESKVVMQSKVKVIADSGYQGLQKIHSNTLLPKKKSKKAPLSKEDKKNNTMIASQRVSNEHAIGFIKRFKIVSDRYRNRRKRFGLRFNLIAGICNYEK
jgi:hypothetical protein